MTFLHYVSRDAHDNGELSPPTTNRAQAQRDLERLRLSYPFARLVTVGVHDEEADE